VNEPVPELRGIGFDTPISHYADHLRSVLAANAFRTKGDRTRHRLRIAAAEALEADGFQGLKVSDICARADVAQGTFYVYFRDKIEIAVDVLVGFIDSLYVAVQKVSRGKDDFESIRLSNLFFIRAYSANRGLMRCHVQMLSQEPAFAAAWLPHQRQWQERLARSIERRTGGRLAGFRALAVATALEGMVFNYLYTAVVTRDELADDDGTRAGEMADMLSILWYRAVFACDPDHIAGGWPPSSAHKADNG
jgi:AcrR family transcriptional regulator